jgi:hypothetical protein
LINLQAISLKIFGPQVWALRGVSALFGTLTILGLYFLTKELFGKRPACFATFLTAVSFWHINFSRIGFRAIMVPFFTVFAFYFLFKALRTQKLCCYIFAGLCLGLGLHTYIAFRFVPILATLVLSIYFLEWRQNHKTPLPSVKRWYGFFFNRGFQKLNIFLAIAAFCVLPLGIYFFNNPEDFMGRTEQVSVFSSDNFFKELNLSSGKSFLKIFWSGDYNWRHNLAGAPQLLWPIGILFIIGFAVSIKEIICRKARALEHWFLILGFFLMSLPEILTVEGLPHALRSIGTIPFVFMFSGLGVRFVLSEIKSSVRKIFINIAIGLILITLGWLGAFQYFYLWDNRPEVKDAFSQGLVDIGNYLNLLPRHTVKTVIVNLGGVLVDGIPMPAQTVKFITYQKGEAFYLTEDEFIPEIVPFICQPGSVIVPMVYNQALFEKLKSLLPPQTQIEKINNFWVFKCK